MKKRPDVVRVFASDEDAKIAAVVALIERRPVRPGRTSTDEKRLTKNR